MKYCLSGGAKGSDWLFSLIGKELGYKTIAYSFEGHKVYGGIKTDISYDDLYRYMDEYRRISNILGRIVSNKPYIQKLILRDFYQILGRFDNKTELVIAVGALQGLEINVQGGTGYAVCIAMEEKIPIILIDKNSDYSYKWFDYELGEWRTLLNKDIKSLKINKGFTGIGSRDININKARNSIIRLLEKVL